MTGLLLTCLVVTSQSGPVRKDPEPTGPSLHWRHRDERASNNIVPVEIRVYNDVTFRQRMQGLSQQLSNALPLSATTIQQGIGGFQGLTSDRSGFNIGAQTTPVTTPQTILNQAFDTKGNPVALNPANPDVASTRTTTNSASSLTPTIPAAVAPTPSYTSPTASLDAISRFEEYTQLYSEIVGLQTAVDRAASHIFDVGTGARRIPAVLSVPLSITPGPRNRGLVAVVDVSIQDKNDSSDTHNDVLVTSVIPEKRTYNVARSTTSQSAAQAGVVLGVFNLGASFLGQKERLYLAKDFDTVAYQAPVSEPADKAHFGWMYRPVLGQSMVDPGKREAIFALSLAPSNNREGQEQGHRLTFCVKTSWHRQCKGTIDPNPIDEDTYTTDIDLKTDTLSPKLQTVKYDLNPSGQIDVSLAGEGLFPGMDLVVGNRVAAPGSVYDPSSNYLKFSVSPQELVSSDVSYASIYGTSKTLAIYLSKDQGALLRDSIAQATAIANVTTDNPDLADLTIRFPGDVAFAFNQPGQRPVVVVAGKPYGLQPKEVSLACAAGNQPDTYLRLKVPTADLLAQRMATVKVPFLVYAVPGGSFPVRADIKVDCVDGLGFDVGQPKAAGAKGHWTLYAISGRNLKDLEVAFPVPKNVALEGYDTNEFDTLNKQFDDEAQSTFRLVALPDLTNLGKEFILRKKRDDGQYVSRLLSIEVKPAVPPATLILSSVPVGFQGAAVVSGTDVKNVVSAHCATVPLPFGPGRSASGQTEYRVEIPDSLTKVPGQRQITFVLKDGTSVFASLEVTPRFTDSATGG